MRKIRIKNDTDKEVDVLKVSANELDTRTVGMQEIDAFTLDKSMTLETRAEGMQEIDDFTLLLVNQMQTTIAELQQRITTLEGQ